MKRATLFPAVLGLSLALASPLAAEAKRHTFQLHGGYFFGPGPVIPDTALPDGEIRGIRFDMQTLSGEAAFSEEGGVLLSDGKTRANGNIDAGALEIGEQGTGGKSFWLYAVHGGPLNGRETYAFDEDYSMVWTVDLALDPGFAEGIVRVDGFILTTGRADVPYSLQTERGMPGGYDKAGTLPSGRTLLGRVGDFDLDGYLDGVLVASANVPMQADLLPGAPVDNVRGFSTDVAVEPLMAMELAMHGVAAMRPVVEATLTGDKIAKLTDWLKEVGARLDAARMNYEQAFVSFPAERRHELKEIGWRLEAIRQMNTIPLAFLTTYDYPTGNAGESVTDAVGRVFVKAKALAEKLEGMRKGGAK